jgi:hypothetical protein
MERVAHASARPTRAPLIPMTGLRELIDPDSCPTRCIPATWYNRHGR